MTLQERLRDLTEPCREADAEIAEAITGGACIWSRPICGYRFADGGAEVPHYTSSLDATVELVEREIGWDWDIARYEDDTTVTLDGIHQRHHAIPAVAMLLALLDAMGIK